jgi:polyisoprenoid-binding protein YceI
MTVRAAFLLLCSLVPGSVAAQAIDHGRSQISIVSRQMNVPVEAQFRKFSAQIAFNAEKPETSKARIEVDLNSIEIGDPDIIEALRERNWFDTKNYPTAVFTATAVRALAPGKYEVRGPLTMKARTNEAVAVFTVKPAGADRIFEGSFPLRRLQYNVGDAHWRDTSVVADEVQIRFRLYQLAPKPAPSK